jgi:hypothetical protein
MDAHMGTWSHESFGNDDACDWAFDLKNSTDLSFVEITLETVLKAGTRYLEAPDACRAIAAAEVIARLQGRFGKKDTYSENVDEWVVKVKLEPTRAIAEKAHRSLDRILQPPSELLELWQEGDASLWEAAVKQLRARIQS